MKLNLTNKNAIVCASSQGLGKSAAMDLASEGVNLIICSRDQTKINKAREEILEKTNNSVKVVALEVDLDSVEDINNLHSRAEEELGPIDILINN